MSQALPKHSKHSKPVFPHVLLDIKLNITSPIQEGICLDLIERTKKGIKTYGTELHTHNGRNALQDLYEELLDAVQYTKQLLLEEKHFTKNDLIELVEQLKDYTHESHTILGHDERDAEEFVNIFLEERTSKQNK